MNAPTDFAHAAAVERILRAHGVASPQSGGGERSHPRRRPAVGARAGAGGGIAESAGHAPAVRGVLRGKRPFSKRSDGPDGRPPARRSFQGQKRSGENGAGSTTGASPA